MTTIYKPRMITNVHQNKNTNQITFHEDMPLRTSEINGISIYEIEVIIDRHKTEKQLIKEYEEIAEAYKRFQFLVNLHLNPDGVVDDG